MLGEVNVDSPFLCRQQSKDRRVNLAGVRLAQLSWRDALVVCNRYGRLDDQEDYPFCLQVKCYGLCLSFTIHFGLGGEI